MSKGTTRQELDKSICDELDKIGILSEKFNSINNIKASDIKASDGTTLEKFKEDTKSQLDDMVIKQDENTKQIEQNKNELNNKMDKTGGEFTGITRAYSNTSYSVAQVRNIILSNKDADVSLLKDGEIWIKYK